MSSNFGCECLPSKLDGQFHPILDVYSVILSLYREIDQKTSILDDFDAISQIIQKWMIVGHQ